MLTFEGELRYAKCLGVLLAQAVSSPLPQTYLRPPGGDGVLGRRVCF